MIKLLKWLLAVFLLIGISVGLLLKFSPSFKKTAEIRALDRIGDIATKRISENPDARGTVAAEFINIPIEAREIASGIWQATGVGNTHLITTSEKDVLFDTGLATQVPKQMNALNSAVSDLDLSHIIVSHSHADHQGGTHTEFGEEQRYLTELQDYFWGRNRALFPFMPEKPPRLGLIAYGGIEPTIRVQNDKPYKFSQGGVDFEVYALPGAEGADNIVLWLPQRKILFSGDFFGPLFPQFPNIFTMRGEKIRKPVEYVNSLDVIIELDPDLIIPSHKDPVTDKDTIRLGLAKMRDATKFVHDATVDGMNAGRTVEELMASIELPPELNLPQQHGKVSWAVKSIWEYYATWFHFDKTTELYAVPQETVFNDIVELAGREGLTSKADMYNSRDEPLKAIHLTSFILEGDPKYKPALKAKKTALNMLLKDARSLNNSYEIYWLTARLREVQASLDAQ